MRRLALIPLVMFAVACGDSTLTEPELALSPEMDLAQARGGQGSVVKMVPFKGKGTWWSVAGDPTACDQYTGQYPDVYPTHLAWEGVATHLGLFYATTTNCVEDQINWRLLSHTTTIIAANGDILYVYGSEDDGTEMVIDWSDPDLSFEIVGPPFVGGTGRFENATGYYHVFGESLFGGAYTMEGQLSSVGSSK